MHSVIEPEEGVQSFLVDDKIPGGNAYVRQIKQAYVEEEKIRDLAGPLWASKTLDTPDPRLVLIDPPLVNENKVVTGRCLTITLNPVSATPFIRKIQKADQIAI